MFETSESTVELDKVLAEAQGEIESALKDKANSHFKNRYADYAAVWGVCQPILKKYGITFTQWPIATADNRVSMLARVGYKGEWMRSTFSLPAVKQDPQGFGSAITYLRRYMLSSILGVASEDDDGEAAVGRSNSGLLDGLSSNQALKANKTTPVTWTKSPSKVGPDLATAERGVEINARGLTDKIADLLPKLPEETRERIKKATFKAGDNVSTLGSILERVNFIIKNGGK